MNPLDLRAMAMPILPAPTIPRVLPVMSPPMNCSGPQPFQVPERIARSDSTTLLDTVRRSAHAISAVASVSTSGVLETGMPRLVASARSILSNPTA